MGIVNENVGDNNKIRKVFTQEDHSEFVCKVKNPEGEGYLYFLICEGEFSQLITEYQMEGLGFYLEDCKPTNEFFIASYDRKVKVIKDILDKFDAGNFEFDPDFFEILGALTILQGYLPKDTQSVILNDPTQENITHIPPLTFKWEKKEVEPFKIFTIEAYGENSLLLRYPAPKTAEEMGAEHVFLINIKRLLKNRYNFNAHVIPS